MRTIVLLIIAAGLSNAQNEAPIREGEKLLANAVRTGNSSALLRLTDRKLRVSVDCGSVIKSFRTELYRDNWVNNISHLRDATYKVAISDVGLVHRRNLKNPKLPYSELATARVEETIHFVTPHSGIRVERLSAFDLWAKVDGAWKLTNRSYAPKSCSAGPHLNHP